jgi:hypothetical protein
MAMAVGSISPARRTFAIVLVAASVVAAPAFAQSPVGWTMAMTISVDSGTGAPPIVMTTKQQHIPGKVRMDFTTSTLKGPQTAGMYTVMNDIDSTITSVMPGMRMATVTSLAAFGTLPARVKSGAEHVAKDSVDDLGDGEPILGRPTHHYREMRAGTLDVSMGDQMCVQHFNSVDDEWLALDPELMASMAADKPTAISAFAEMAPDLSSGSTKMPKGVSLRSVHTSTSGSARQPKTVTMTMDITELERGELPDSLFVVPTGYNKMDMRKMMADMPAGMMESAMKTAMANTMKGMCDSGGH